ncbi:MAG TPA: redoxin domain-containing protein [Dehalococcoidales bacterium]|nr:redoxin domain-containing protein [Dehalococcoidales bacterium]
MNKMLRLTLIAILTLGLLITGCGSPGPSEARIGGVAPNFTLDTPDGQNVSLKDFKGKSVLINFWASWCGPCAIEMPHLQEVYEEWSGKGFVLLAINAGESYSKVGEFVQRYSLSFPVLLDTEKVVTRRYNVIAYPTTFFIDKDGVIQEKIIGAFRSKADIEQKLSRIIS